MRRPLVVITLIAGVVLLASLTTGVGSAATDTLQGKVMCKLEGTASGCCIGKLEKKLEGVKGVKDAHIDAKAGTATITIEKGAKVSIEDIKKAVAEADKGHNHGFKVIEIKEAQ